MKSIDQIRRITLEAKDTMFFEKYEAILKCIEGRARQAKSYLEYSNEADWLIKRLAKRFKDLGYSVGVQEDSSKSTLRIYW